jgi:hypothetical protein
MVFWNKSKIIFTALCADIITKKKEGILRKDMELSGEEKK